MKSAYGYIKIVVSLVAVAALLAVAMPRTEKFHYSYTTGSRWTYGDLHAEIDFPLLKTEEQLQEEQKGAAANPAVPYYRFDTDCVASAVKTVEGLGLGELTPVVVSSIRSILSKGVVEDEGIRWSGNESSSDVLYIQKGKRVAKYPASEVWKVSDARLRLLDDVQATGTAVNADSLLSALGVYDLIACNLTFDEKNTQLFNSDEPVISTTSGMVGKGEHIVSEGEFITAEIAQVLDSYRAELNNRGYVTSSARMWAGNILLSIVMVVLLFLVILFTRPSIFQDNRFFYILMVFLLTGVGTLMALRSGGKVFLIVPYTLAALYLQAFFRMNVIAPVYMVSLLPLLVFAEDGTVWFMMFLLAGLLAAYSFQHLSKGWHQFAIALLTFVVLSVGLGAFMAAGVIAPKGWASNLVRLLVASSLAVAGYPLIYLFERIFSLVSNSRLLELCDTTNPLLRKLEQVAPGTFQHSLQVMNMADAAARSIGANSLLARAGALYHDIGKTSNPQCFVENESLMERNEADKYHFGRTPMQSAHDIIMHTTEGAEMARRNHLPSIITDFILTHHGDSRVSYFYHKAVESGEAVAESEFCYPGKRPVTKEQGILMLCDSVEAASRSLRSYTSDDISAFVDKIVQGKLDEHQLDGCSLTLRDLVTVKDTLKTYLAQMHHERIAYPESRKANNK